jgi:hypothetical protein
MPFLGWLLIGVGLYICLGVVVSIIVYFIQLAAVIATVAFGLVMLTIGAFILIRRYG